MRILVGLVWLILFLLMFGFALNNTAPAELRFFAGAVWRAPLVAVLLVFFVVGVVFGFLAMLPLWFRQRLELRRLRKAGGVDQGNGPSRAGAAAQGGSAKAGANGGPGAQGSNGADTLQSVAQVARTTN